MPHLRRAPSQAADVYLAWTYARYEAMRTLLRSRDNKIDIAERFSLATTNLHGLASMVWMCLWLVGPPDGRWEAHLAIFSTAIVCRYLCTLGNYVECRFGGESQRERVTRAHTVFIIIYGLVTTLLPILYFVDILVYQAQGRVGVDPPLPWYVLQTMDVLWVGCLAASTRMSVPEPPILIARKVLEFDEEFDPDEYSPEQQALMRRLGYTEVSSPALGLA